MGRRDRTRLESLLERSLGGFAIEHSPLVVGVSGGADSMALLDGLCRWKKSLGWTGKIIVAHLNHLLRGSESDADEEFVRMAAASLGLAFESERCDVSGIARARRGNLESVARDCRYDFLHRVALTSLEADDLAASALILTAHNSDDQAETVLMRLLRGSGASGLTGIHPQRQLSRAVRLIRPLLNVDRATVLEHCRHYGIDFRTDQSNFSIEYLRNRVRHELLVTLRSYNGSISETLVRTAELLRDDEACLQELAGEHRQRAMVDGGLSITVLRNLPVALRRRVVRDWIAERRGGLARLTSAHFAAIEGLIERSQSGRRIELPGALVVQRIFDLLQLHDESTPLLSPQVLVPGEVVDFGDFWIMLDPGPEPAATLPPGGGRWTVRLSGEPPVTPWRVRARCAGDSLHPTGSRHRIKLKKLMIRHKIPLTKRDTWPIVVTGEDQLVWVPGLALSAEFALADHPLGGDQQTVGSPAFWLHGGEKMKLVSENGADGVE